MDNDATTIPKLVAIAYKRIKIREKLPSHGHRGQIDRKLGERIGYSQVMIKQFRLGRANYASEGAKLFFEELSNWGSLATEWQQAVSALVGYPIGDVFHVVPAGFPNEDRPTAFVGRAQELAIAHAILLDPQGCGVAIEGMGGIGKTRLARQIVQQCRDHFEHVIVVNAKPLLFAQRSEVTVETILDALRTIWRQPRATPAQLQTRLAEQRTLLTLDNLETAEQSQHAIIQNLMPFLGHSKLLVTSRHRFGKQIQRITLRGLDLDAAFVFMHAVAVSIGLKAFAEIPTDDLHTIYAKTGGSPLAMRLVIAQLEESSLTLVLQRLAQLPSLNDLQDEDDYVAFYRHIFQFSWSQLSEDARIMLIALAHITPQDGISLQDLGTIIDAGWSAAKLDRVRSDVWRKSFLEIHATNGVGETRYFLHPLVTNFVESEIVQLGGWHE